MSSAHDQLWFRHPTTCWALGDIKQFHGKEVELRNCADSSVARVALGDTHPCDTSHLLDSTDIAHMNNMHEGPLLALLERRYRKAAIYTFTGDILISINPYKTIIDTLIDYKEHRDPHVFAVAERSYRQMMEETNPAKKNQSLIVSGESGAGKTEACKHVMRYLATLSERFCQNQLRRNSAVNTISSVEKRVLDCNPFLEAFGNAKTVRNDNSSRFGKFLKIEYSGGRILGARIRHYLLEKARVVSPQAGERNYHIFYQLTRGCSSEDRAHWKLGPAESYAYLSHGGLQHMNVNGVDDGRDFEEVCDALESVGIEECHQKDMFAVLAGLLHLGNVEFGENEKNEAFIVNADAAVIAAQLLGANILPTKLIRRDALAKTIYERMFTWLISRCNVMLSSDASSSGFIGILDIFGFEIFDINSFEQLCINYANEKLQNLFNVHIFIMEQEQYHAEGVDMTTISFINNQPCVDLIEKRPSGILTMLDEVCLLGRSTTDAAFLEALDKTHKGKHAYYGNPKKKSVDRFSVLHFAGEVPYCVDGFIEKNNDTLYSDLEELMVTSTCSFLRETFETEVLDDSERTPTEDGSARQAGAGAGSRTQSTSTIASKFKRQLGALNDTLLATTPHYVRCIKPNKIKSDSLFDHGMILAQLLYAGVLETVRIRRQGFPFRETYAEFWRRACRVGLPLLVDECSSIPPPPPAVYSDASGKSEDISLTDAIRARCRTGCEILCSALLKPTQWTKGHTKLFLKDMALDQMMALFRRYHALRVMAWWKMAKQRRAYRRFKAATMVLQRAHKGNILRRRFQAVAKQVAILQAHARRRILQKRFARLKRIRANAAAKVQSLVKMWYTRKRQGECDFSVLVPVRCLLAQLICRFQLYLKGLTKLQASYFCRRESSRYAVMKRAATILQCFARMGLAKRKFARMKRARCFGAVMIQAAWRGYWARTAYLQLKLAAVKAASHWRRIAAARAARKLHGGIVIVQSFARKLLARRRYKSAVRALVRVQTWYKAEKVKLMYRRIKKAALRIERAMVAFLRAKCLTTWIQEVFASAAWGDINEMNALLACSDSQFARLRDIPVSERVRLRNRDDGMKGLLHAAAASGRLESVQLLVDLGADILAQDALGATALHKAAAVGDSHLSIVRYLTSCAREVDAISAGGLLNASTTARDTALDVAIQKCKSGGRRDHDLTIKYLLECGGVAHSMGDNREAVELLLKQPRGEQLLAAAAAARERDVMERRARERREDPHYQFLYLSEQQRQKRAEKAQHLSATPLISPAPVHSHTSISVREPEVGEGSLNSGRGDATSFYGPANSNEGHRGPSAPSQLHTSPASVHQEHNGSFHGANEVLPVALALSPLEKLGRTPMPHSAAPLPSAASPAGSPDYARVVPEAAALTTQVIDFFVRADVKQSLVGRPLSNLPLATNLTRPLATNLTRSTHSASAPAFSPLVKPTSSRATALFQAEPLTDHSAGLFSAGLHSSQQLQEMDLSPVLLGSARRGSAVAGTFSPGPVRSSQFSPALLAAPSAYSTGIYTSALPIWTVHQSATTGLLYYHNRESGETQWEQPLAFDGTYEPWQLEAAARQAAAQLQKSSSAGLGSLLERDRHPSSLASNRPAEIQLQAVVAAGSSATIGRRTVGLGRNNWAVAVDEDGYVYYFNTLRGLTQWERPSDF